jgi:glutamate transport system substrate-binding protein
MKAMIKILSLLVISTVIFQPLQARTLQEIKKTGYIVVGTIAVGMTNPKKPVHYLEPDGTPTGIDIDMIHLIARELGVQLKIKFLQNLKERISLLTTNGNVDIVVSSFSITEKRLEKINFSIPYLITGVGVILQDKFRDSVHSFNDLQDQTIAVIKYATGQKLLEEFFPSLPLKVFLDRTEVKKNLDLGQIDGYANDRLFLLPMAADNPGKYYVLPGTLSADPYGVGVSKKHPALLNAIDKIIEEAEKSGQLEEIIAKHTTKKSIAHPQMYKVVTGDSLSKIAIKFYEDATKWRVIYEANKQNIPYPNVVKVDQELTIPPLSTTKIDASTSQATGEATTSQPNRVCQSSDLKEKLKRLKELRQEDLIEEELYREKQRELLKRL